MSSRFSWVAVLLTLGSSSSPTPQRISFDLHPTHRRAGEDAHARLSSVDARRLELKNTKLRGDRAKPVSHAVSLQNYGDVQYHMLLEIGSPCKQAEDRQIFRVVPDTGSSDLWVFADNCTHCAGRRYAQSKSCSSKPIGNRVEFKYGDGTTASGTAVRDTVKIGDIVVKDQFFIQVDDMDAATLEESDGILGLAHHYEDSKQNTEGHTFMATLFKEHPEMVRQFSLFLTGMDDRPSKIVFGDPDLENHAKESFAYGKAYYMSHTDLWLTSVYSIGFSHTGVERVFPTADILGAPALVDSGSSLIVLMPDIWDDLIEELGKHLLDCRIEDTDGSVAMCSCPKDFDSIPSLVINLIDQDNLEHPLCMSAEEYMIRSIDSMTGKSTCVPAIQRGNRKQPVPLIFGMTFMRAFYTNFDLENHRIGFARSSLSALPAHADCTVHNKKERNLWLLTTAFVAVVVGFSLYLCLCGDVGACCGWPSCEATQPCCHSYNHLEKVQDKLDSSDMGVADSIQTLSVQNGASSPRSKGAHLFGPETTSHKAMSDNTLRLQSKAGIADSRPSSALVAPEDAEDVKQPPHSTAITSVMLPVESEGADPDPHSARTV